MDFNIRGSKVEVTNAIENYITEKIGKLNKYFEKPDELTANVLIRVNGIAQTVEVTIPIKKALLRAEDTNKDLYSAIDLVYEKLERQIRKNKTRMSRKAVRSDYSLFADFDLDKNEEENGLIVKRKTFDAKPMNEEEAILQMNLIGHDFFIYNDVDTNNVSVIYKRKDGNYGIIEMK